MSKTIKLVILFVIVMAISFYPKITTSDFQSQFLYGLDQILSPLIILSLISVVIILVRKSRQG